MIQGFFKVVQEDVAFMVDYLGKKETVTTHAQDDKARLVSLRIFAALGMTLSAVMGIKSFTAETATGAILKLATAVFLYTVNHDLFVIGVNAEKDLLGQVVAIGKSMLNDAKDLLKGKKTLDDAPSHPYTEGTFYKSFWDQAFAQG